MNFIAGFERIDQKYKIMIGFSLIFVLGILDYITGPTLIFSSFYIFPIALITWQLSKPLGYFSAVLSITVWLLANLVPSGVPQAPTVYMLNMVIEFVSMVMIILLISSIRNFLDLQRKISEIDTMTGAMNAAAFMKVIQNEIIRSNRYHHEFSVIYFDIDDFKQINDRFGHITGNEVLRSIVTDTRKQLRHTDFVGRLGGDEFGILLPESNSEAAESVVMKIRQEIADSGYLQDWMITLSIGVLTCIDCVESTTEPDVIMRLVDNLMYSAKQNGKNAVQTSKLVGMDLE